MLVRARCAYKPAVCHVRFLCHLRLPIFFMLFATCTAHCSASLYTCMRIYPLINHASTFARHFGLIDRYGTISNVFQHCIEHSSAPSWSAA